jgi:hypothetical protein
VKGKNVSTLLTQAEFSDMKFEEMFRAEKGNVEIWVGQKFSWLNFTSSGMIIIKEIVTEDICEIIILHAGGEYGPYRVDWRGNHFEKQIYEEIVDVCKKNNWKISVR